MAFNTKLSMVMVLVGSATAHAFDELSQGRFYASDGARVQFFEFGDPNDPTLIISPAYSGSAAVYAHRFGHRLAGYHVIAVQLRGHGRGGGCEWNDLEWCSSEQSPEDGRYFGLRVARMARDVAETAEVLDLESFTLCGHSMGGNVLYSYVSQFGTASLDGLFIYDQSPKNLVDGTPEDASFPSDAASYPMDAFLDTVASLPVFSTSDGYSNVPSDLTSLLGGIDGQPSILDPANPTPSFVMTQAAWDNWMAFADQLNGKILSVLFWSTLVSTYTDVMTTIAHSNVPVLVYGGKSSIVPWETMQWVHEKIPNSTFMLFDESVGVHGAFLNPEPSQSVFYDGVRSFLDGLQPCVGDVSGDGIVNAIDLMQLLSCWGDVKSVACEACDFDATGAVDVTDLLALFEHWGPCDT